MFNLLCVKRMQMALYNTRQKEEVQVPAPQKPQFFLWYTNEKHLVTVSGVVKYFQIKAQLQADQKIQDCGDKGHNNIVARFLSSFEAVRLHDA